MKSFVIFTHSKDNESIVEVASRVRDAGIRIIRFDTDLYPTQYMIDTEMNNSSCDYHLTLPSGQQISSADIDCVWYRRFYIGHSINHRMDTQARETCVEESTSAALGFLDCLDCFKLDCYWDVRRASVKEHQLNLARKIGFHIPNTLITNNGYRSQDFYHGQNMNIVVKNQRSSGFLLNGSKQVMYTSDVKEDDLDDIAGLKLCPMVFQEKITNALELRIIVVGSLVFSAALDTNRCKDISTDLRCKTEQKMSDWFEYQLPKSIEEKILSYTKSLNLNYGSIDMLLTPGGQYVFLEINPCGEFYWLERFTGLKISDAIANLLIDACR